MAEVELIVGSSEAGTRLDAFLATHLPKISRVKIRRSITAGGVTVDGNSAKPAYKLNEGQVVAFTPPEVSEEGPPPQEMPLDILYEDEFLAAINKPPDLVVHPGKGNWFGTLASGLAFHFQNLSTVGGPRRPGIVHRLDRDTSGVTVVAKTDEAHLKLAEQFNARTAEKEYLAVVSPAPDRDRDAIEQPIGVHPYQREKMAIRADHDTSREAYSFYEVEQRFVGFAAVKVLPKTGRTHQIRLHLAHIGCPILCDRLYSGRSQITRGEITRNADDTEILLARQALHARRLKLKHPISQEPLEFEAPVPDDMASVLRELKKHRQRAK